jgi:hypothetical protein
MRSTPAWVNELTKAKRAVLESPYSYHRPIVEDDGVTVTHPFRTPS